MDAGFRDRYGPWAIVAGASDGIGAAFAASAASRGCNVVLVSRSEEKLRSTAARIEAEHHVETRDLTADTMMDDVITATSALDIGLAVYNAGATHGVARFVDREAHDHLYLVNLSCRGPILWAHHFGRRLLARRRGGIVLMSSMSGFVGSALTATYSATKAFDLCFGEGLWREMRPEGIDVLVAVAGLTNTPSMVSSGCKLEGFPLMEPEEVSEGALRALGGPDPAWISDANIEMYQLIRTQPRVETVELMSNGAAFLYDAQLAPLPTDA
jgi:short-subunit dehydrogenase